MNDQKAIWINGHEHIAFRQDAVFSAEEMTNRSKEYYEWLNRRRSVRMFSDKPVPKTVIENLIRAAATAPPEEMPAKMPSCAASARVVFSAAS